MASGNTHDVRRTQSLIGKPKSRGHSLIELLVVLIIVSVLIAILLPAVQRSRESARMAQCIHNQGQLAKAVHLHITDEPYGRFPGYRAFAADGTTQIGWAPQVFEYLGRSDLPEDPTQATHIEVLVCPSDQGPNDAPRLNYVVNGGRAGTDSPADGVFFDHAKAARVYMTKDDFRDGLTNTIMLAENLDATEWNVIDEASQCILWPLTDGNEINIGTGARPSSHHPGGFVAAFADGSVKFMSEVDLNEDPYVYSEGSLYTALLTPGGDDSYESTVVVEVDPCNPPDDTGSVNSGIQWLVNHQFDDGSWSLQHNTHPDCNGSCGNNGSLAVARNAATGLALLPLLGAGSSPVSGDYKDSICRGVNYLLAKQGSDGSLWESDGQMYGHLIAHLALAEALALGVAASEQQCTESSGACSVNFDELRTAVEKAVEFTTTFRLSDKGWRYDLTWTSSCTAHLNWGIIALHASKRAGVSVPPEVYEELASFLDTQQQNPVTSGGVTIGAEYVYDIFHPTHTVPTDTTNCLGLLSRVFLGTPVSHAAITQFTDQATPSQDGDVYFDMHTTQLMYRVGGSSWDTWKAAIDAYYSGTQATSGHESGSWFMAIPKDPSKTSIDNWVRQRNNTQGGRLYVTVMALLSLEEHFKDLRLGE